MSDRPARCNGAGISITWEAFVGVTAQLKSSGQISRSTLMIFWVVYTLAKMKITTSNHKEIWTLKRQNYGKHTEKSWPLKNKRFIWEY